MAQRKQATGVVMAVTVRLDVRCALIGNPALDEAVNVLPQYHNAAT